MKLFYKNAGDIYYTTEKKTFRSRTAALLWLRSEYKAAGTEVSVTVDQTPKGAVYVTVNF